VAADSREGGDGEGGGGVGAGREAYRKLGGEGDLGTGRDKGGEMAEVGGSRRG